MSIIKKIQGYEDQIVSYSGITIDDRFFFYYVSKKISADMEEHSGFQAGILRYDVLTDNSEFFSYSPSRYFESYIPGKTSIHSAELHWEQTQATFIIYKFACVEMSSSEVYRLNFTDSIANSSVTSRLWGLEMYSLNDQYLLLAIPELDPFSDKDNHGFEEYLLIDIVNQVSYSIPRSLGQNDSILNFSDLQVITFDEIDYLILHTGRMTLPEKQELWTRKGKLMQSSSAYQSRLVLPLEEFIHTVKERRNIKESYIIDQCDHSSAYVNTLVHASWVYVYKTNCINHTSELVQYHIPTQSKRSIPFIRTFDRIILKGEELVGILKNSSQKIEQMYDLAQGTELFTGLSDQVIKWVNKDMIIIQCFSKETGLRHLQIYDSSTQVLVYEIVGTVPTFHYMESQDLVLIFQ